MLAEHKAPAASIAVYAHGETIDRAAGVLNKNTGVEATADSVFRIGSITKVWTATFDWPGGMVVGHDGGTLGQRGGLLR
ncbi:serine hydrolase [Streptomyces sp. NPDC059398]|uniref:serine hydrolase n=1 Tax=Streptomyces sp. NPDC059398 TaxID=3346820 RepID=UPI0036944B0A